MTGGLRWFVCAGRGRRTPVPTRRRCGSSAASPARDTHAPTPPSDPRRRRSPLPAQTCRQLGSRMPGPHPLPARPPPALPAPPGARPFRSRGPRPRRPGAPRGRRRQRFLPVQVPGAEVSPGEMEAVGQGSAGGIPGRGQHRAAAQSRVLGPSLHSAAASPGRARNLSSRACVSARAAGRRRRRATSGSAGFKNARPAAPCPVGRKPGTGDTHARASRLQQGASKPAGGKELGGGACAPTAAGPTAGTVRRRGAGAREQGGFCTWARGPSRRCRRRLPGGLGGSVQ